MIQLPNVVRWQAVHGSFSGTKTQEICVGRGRVVELLRPDPNTGKVHTLLSQEVFGVVRSLVAFRLTGGTKGIPSSSSSPPPPPRGPLWRQGAADYIVLGSDSGKICILEYKPEKNALERVHLETYGKSGCRRTVPGQFLAVDPKGRSVMVGAAEKAKLVYILNRDTAARLTISSPLEAHKSNTVCFAITGVDVGFENPTYACLEIDFEVPPFPFPESRR